MAEQNVVIKIQADVSKATNDVKALQQVIAKLSTSGTQAASGTERVSNAAKKTATASQLLDREIKKVVAGQGNLQKVSILAKKALDEQAAASKRLQQASAAVEQAVGKQGAAALSGSGQIGGLADASGSASFALLSLGQAFQDSAQFGMGFAQGLRAVNNNIQQTFTALALGSVQAGGFTNLLKLMGGSLWGPGGLILGFSAVSAALEFFSTRAQRAKKEGDNLAEAFNKLFTFSSGVEAVNISSSESFERLADGYEALAKEQDKVVEANTEIIYQETRAGRARVGERLNEEAKDAQAAAAQFRLYAQEQKKSAETARRDEEALVARNRVLGINGVRVENLTTKRRDLTRALVDLQTPLSDEAKAIQQGNIALQNQIDALEKARDLREQLQAAIGARTLSDQEKENVIAEERIDLYEREREAREQIAINSRLASDAAFAADRERVVLLESVAASGLATVAEFNAKFLETNTIISSIHAQSVLTEEQFAKLFSTGGIEDFIRKLRDEHTVLTDLQKITKELGDLRGQINSADFEAIAVKQLELDLEQQFADAQRQNIQLAALKASLEAGDETQLAITTAQIAAIKGVNEGLREQVKLLLIKRGMTVEEIEGIFSGLGITEDDEENTDKMSNAMKRLNAALLRTASQGIAKVTEGFISMATTGESFNTAILGPIADLAIQLGRIAIATGLGIEAIRESLRSLNGPVAVAAGIALVALGKYVKSRIKSMATSPTSAGSSAAGIRGAGNLQEFNVGNLYSGTPNLGSAAGFPSLSIASMAPQGMQLQLVARGPDLVSAVDAQRSANTRLIGGSR